MEPQNQTGENLQIEENVQYSEVGKVAYITLNNPKKKNAIDMSMVKKILDSLKKVEENQKIKCLVIRSIGESVFCAGWDLNMFKVVNQELIDNLLNIGSTVSRTIFFMSKPVIVQIQGACVGMGTIISLAADFRIVKNDPNIFFQLPELDIGPGIFPATGPTVGAVNILGMAHAKDMLLTGRKIPLLEFDRWGGVTQLVDRSEDLNKHVKKFARKLSSKSDKLLKLTKSAINIMSNRIAKECWDLENEMARHYFDGFLGNEVEVEDDDEFINIMWQKYGKGLPNP